MIKPGYYYAFHNPEGMTYVWTPDRLLCARPSYIIRVKLRSLKPQRPEVYQ